MTRQEIIEGFHRLYLEKIAEETARRGSRAGIPVEELKAIHNATIADYYEQLLGKKIRAASSRQP
jgi:hypothetical protein